MEYSELWDMNTAGWRVDPDDHCITIAPCDEIGALTISSARKVEGTITSDEVVRMAQQRVPSETTLVPLTCGEFSGVRGEYEEQGDGDEVYWRAWWLYSDRVLLFVTYNCNPEHRGVHQDVVDWMLGTLRNTSTDTIRMDR